MARDYHGQPLCAHESIGPCDRWWCTYRLLIALCALFLAPAGASVAAPQQWATAATVLSIVAAMLYLAAVMVSVPG